MPYNITNCYVMFCQCGTGTGGLVPTSTASREVQAAGCKPSVVTFNTLLRACEGARAWRLSVHLWSYMLDCGLHPDIVSVRAWITAMHAAGCWPGVLLALQQRLPRAVGKDPILQGKLCEALWSAGANSRREFTAGARCDAFAQPASCCAGQVGGIACVCRLRQLVISHDLWQ